MADRQKIIKIGQWLIQLFLFVVIPVLVFFFGFNHLQQLQQSNRLSVVEQNLKADLLNFEANNKTEAFLARFFLDTFAKAKAKAEKPEKVLKDSRKLLDNAFDYILWDSKGKIIAATINTQNTSASWYKTWQTLRKPFFRSPDLSYSDAELANARNRLGPQLMLQGISLCGTNTNERLLITDSTEKFPRAWICCANELSLLITVKADYLNSRPGLKLFMDRQNHENADYQLGYVESDSIVSNYQLPDPAEAKEKLTKHTIANGLRFETQTAFYYPRVIDNQLSIFAVIGKDSISKGSADHGPISAVVIFLLLLPMVIFSGQEAFGGKQLRIPLSRKLGLLFVYSNGLPLAILFFIGFDYINQKQYALLDEIHAQGISFLQNFDERFESEHSLRIFKIKTAIASLSRTLSSRPLTVEVYQKFAAEMTEVETQSRSPRFFLVASDSRVFGSSISFENKKQIVQIGEEQLSHTELKRRIEEYRISRSIGEYIISSLNGQSIDSKSATEVELIAESTMQKTITEVQHEFLAGSGKISIWGMGTSTHYAYIDMFSLSGSQKYDYMLMYSWAAGNLERGYLDRQYLNANRNIDDLTICVINEKENIFYPQESAGNMILRHKLSSFTHKPNATRQFVTINNRDYLIMGLRGKSIKDFCLAGLYPVNKVAEKIAEEKKMLITAGLMSLLLALALGQLLSHSITFPLRILSEGAEAIRQRNFSHRLPPMGNDEFGKMAGSFNEAMIDLEELKIAGAVQEHLLPKKLPESGTMKLYGQSVSMGDLGGDYFDYFNTGDRRFSVLIGDVSGRGAGAALVMAMAKAGIMQMNDYLEKPSELLLHMHNLICAAKSSDRQFMTLQYLNFDFQTAKAIYANAGGWNPLIVNAATKTVREIALPGPMLGALNKPKFSDYEIALQEGEALLLYTDGLVEGCDFSGKPLGITGLKELALKCFNPEPKDYCSRLIEEFKNFTGKKKLQDDITILMVIRS